MWAITAVTILLATREIVRGIRYSQLSGFRFYLINGLVQGILLFLAATLIIVRLGHDYFLELFIGAMFLSMVLGHWESWQERKADKAGSPKWKEWDNLRKQTSFRDRLLSLIFFDGSKKTKQD